MTEPIAFDILIEHEEEVRFSPYDYVLRLCSSFMAGLCVPAFLLPMEVFSH